MKVRNIGELPDYQQREIMDLFFPKQEVKYTWPEQEAAKKVAEKTPRYVEQPAPKKVEETGNDFEKEAQRLARWYLEGDGIGDYHMYIRNPTIHAKIGDSFESSDLFISGEIIWKGKSVIVRASLLGIEDAQWPDCGNMEASDVTAFYDDYDSACNDVLVFVWSCYNEV